MDALLTWKPAIYAEVPEHTKEGLNATLLVPLGGLTKALNNARKDLSDDGLHPLASSKFVLSGAQLCKETHFNFCIVGSARNS